MGPEIGACADGSVVLCIYQSLEGGDRVRSSGLGSIRPLRLAFTC